GGAAAWASPPPARRRSSTRRSAGAPRPGSQAGKSSRSELQRHADRAPPVVEPSEVDVEVVAGGGLADVPEVPDVSAHAEALAQVDHHSRARIHPEVVAVDVEERV